ncbi:response regulator [Chryseobacterium daecheongense]|uniref:Helix-turn-helix domain-containing protein n=1 Tax=Chryseobacterium daecheongense TaxID=192389 RepID=A0A3N0VUB2_9FLAO|nr:helix-turn-helix domain-containing protein [Chryseobacterium daecheongense]ROH96321.1 helix-turn-helix domain-containing protein [Chryseobacterium daecheongense]TDX89851.1 helix-turn-helix protein [Chryseobacterium daecheongense]
MIAKRTTFLLFLLIFFNFLYSQQRKAKSFEDIRKEYEQYEENDINAFQYVDQYISKAKKEKNYSKLVQGYKDGVFYSSSNENKLAYADSTIGAANLSEDNELISMAYLGKGIVYYFNYKRYQLALNEYLQAYQYSKTIKDEYLKHKIIYHLGVVKSYLGYYEDALIHFKECADYFSSEIREKKLHPNMVFNNKKGYFNSLHQMVECYLDLNDYRKSDSLIDIGLKNTVGIKDFSQEESYFLKCKGISCYYKKEYKNAIRFLNQSLPRMLKNNNFAWASVNYFYIGKSYQGLENEEMAIGNFKKVDSIFQKYHFIHPEIRKNYEALVSYYKKQRDVGQELYYTKQLLKADSIITQDFSYLSSKIHKEYDTGVLYDEKKKLERQTLWSTNIIYGLIALMIVLMILLIIKYSRERNIHRKYILLEEKIRKNQMDNRGAITEGEFQFPKERKSKIDDDKVQNILEKLEQFEEKKQFNQKGLTLTKLALKLGTNANYLSQVINEYKGSNFNKYLGELRINYITQQIYNNKTYLNYTIESYAEECGIASRQNFSDLFYEINGVRPKDFIKNRKRELDN